MRRLLLAFLGVAMGAGAATADLPDFVETFTYPDGSIPTDWVWTGDPQGGGEFAVQNGEFVHLDGGYVYYVRLVIDYPCDQGTYEFDVKDSNWEFAWQITGTSESGGCWRLYHNDAWGQPGFTLSYGAWSTLPEYPDGLYMFHNCEDWYVYHHWTEPLVGWHHITIADILGFLTITLDDSEEIFWARGSRAGGRESLVGLGATAGSGVGTPAFDNVEYKAYYSGVEETRWGRIKAMYR